MGYNAYIKLIAGYRIPAHKAKKTTTERSCHHSNDEKNKFCSECGKQIWINKEIELLRDDRKIGDFDVVRASDDTFSEYFVGKILKECDLETIYLNPATRNDLLLVMNEDFESELDAELCKAGIEPPVYNERDGESGLYGPFGLHLSIYHSC